jgi:hypothetical protein
MNPQTRMVVGGVCVFAIAGGAYTWLRLPLYRWSCRRCKEIVTVSRFHPGRCMCGAGVLVAFYCGACGSWNTLPSASRHCVACSPRASLSGPSTTSAPASFGCAIATLGTAIAALGSGRWSRTHTF